jgi:hypothetical protein
MYIVQVLYKYRFPKVFTIGIENMGFVWAMDHPIGREKIQW